MKELISERWIKVRVGGSVSKSKQADLGIPQGRVLSVTLFLVAINSILGELGNEMDGSLFADVIAVYNTTINQQAGCMGSGEGLVILSQQNNKHGV